MITVSDDEFYFLEISTLVDAYQHLTQSCSEFSAAISVRVNLSQENAVLLPLFTSKKWLLPYFSRSQQLG